MAQSELEFRLGIREKGFANIPICPSTRWQHTPGPRVADPDGIDPDPDGIDPDPDGIEPDPSVKKKTGTYP